MLAELQRIFGTDVVSTAKMNWQTFSLKIVKQARMESGARITRAIYFYSDVITGEFILSLIHGPPC